MVSLLMHVPAEPLGSIGRHAVSKRWRRDGDRPERLTIVSKQDW